MPSRNVIKSAVPNSYYHIYARGANRQKVFVDAADYHYFLGLLERYLGKEQQKSKAGVMYPHHRGRVKVLAYCLMSNHIHLLVHQTDKTDLEKFMRSLMTSYSRYFNLRYKRTGPLFESRYRAVLVESDQYLQHISRYIHLNPKHWRTYEHSSYSDYLSSGGQAWLDIKPVMEFFASPDDYKKFTSDYDDHKAILDDIKHQLADH